MRKRKSVGIAASLFLGAALVMSGCSGEQNAEPSATAGASAGTAASSVIMVTGDTVSEQGGCVLASRFTAGDKIVFRANAVDPATNQQMGENTQLKVHLSTGEELDMAYGAHPPGSDTKFWVVAYPVTDQTPAGTLDYYITAENGDKKGEYRPFNVAPSLLTIVDPKAAEQPKEEAQASSAPAAPENVETDQTVDIVATNFKFNQDKFYVKAGEEVTVNLTSEEGVHGVFIEGVKAEIKEKDGTVKFTPDKAGEYKIYCSVFCGEGHGDMTATLVVV